MDKWALEEHARTGIMEAVANHTVIIDVSWASSKHPAWGTGSLLKIKDRLFIVTCKHVVRPKYQNEDLRVLYRSTRAMEWTEKEKIKEYQLHRLFQGVSKTFPHNKPQDRFYLIRYYTYSSARPVPFFLKSFKNPSLIIY